MPLPRFIFFSVFVIYALHAQDNEQLSPFDTAVQEIAQQPINTPQTSTPQIPFGDPEINNKSESHFLNYENCKKAIDFIALASAFIRVYVRYQRIYGPPVEPDWLDKAWSAICPDIIQDASQHSRLFKETLEITFETVTIKTVAKLILFCWKGDAFTMMKATALKIRRFFWLLV